MRTCKEEGLRPHPSAAMEWQLRTCCGGDRNCCPLAAICFCLLIFQRRIPTVDGNQAPQRSDLRAGASRGRPSSAKSFDPFPYPIAVRRVSPITQSSDRARVLVQLHGMIWKLEMSEPVGVSRGKVIMATDHDHAD